MSEVVDQNPWFTEAIRTAKDSALPNLICSLTQAQPDDPLVIDTVTMIELCLLSLNDLSPAGVRAALQVVAQPFATQLEMEWEPIADAIVGMLEWNKPGKWTVPR